MRLFLIASLIFCCTTPLDAIETNPFQSISTLDNQSLGIVHDVEVGDGIVWLGADNGIFGLQGDITYHYGAGVEGLDNAVQNLTLDREGSVWAATFGSGLFKVSKTKGVQLTFTENDGLLSNYVLRLEYLSNKYLIIATINGVQILDTNKNRFISLSEEFNTDLPLEESDIEKIDSDTFFVLGKTRSYIFNIETRILEEVRLPDKVFRSFIYRVHSTPSEEIWISTSTGVFKYDSKTKQTEEFSLDTPNDIGARDFLSTKDGNTIIATEGIYQYTDSESTIEVTESLSPFMKNGTIGVISDLEESKSGLILLGGPVFGLTWLPKSYNSISYLNYRSQSAKGRVEGVINIDSGSLISLSGSLYALPSFKSGEIELVNQPDSQFLRSLVVSGNYIYGISKDNRLILVDLKISETDGAAYVQSETVSSKKVLEIEAIGERLVGITQDNKVFELLGNQLVVFNIEDFKPDIIFTSEDYFVAVDYFNKVLLSNDLVNWLPLEHDNLQDAIAIECFERTITGTIYFCTSGDGIVTIKPESATIVPSKLNKLIDSKYIRGIKSDYKGYLWISTNSGLYRADQNGNWVQKVGQKEGVIDLDFEFEGLYLNKSRNNLLVVGDKLNYLLELNEFNTVLDNYLEKQNKVFVSRIKNFSGSGQDEGYIASLESTDDGSRALIENDVYLTEISFAADDAIDHKYLEFEYRLLGLNDTWRKAPKGNASATFSTLPFGNYTFQARAIDQRSLKEQPIESLDIRVLPPIWLTGEAFIIYFLTIMLLYTGSVFWQRTLAKTRSAEIDGVVNEKTATLTRKYEATTKLLADKKTLFSSLSHEMRTPLTIIMGWINHLRQTGQFKVADDKLDSMQQNSMRLKVLVDQLLELERLETNADLPVKSYNIYKLLVLLTESFKPLTQEKYIEVTIKGNKKAQAAAIDGSLDKIFSNIISNAVKYTPEEGTIELYVREKAGMVEVSIADSGDGIDEDDQSTIFSRFSRLEKHESLSGSGIGLAIVKELVNANNGSIDLNSEPGLGSTFTVSLPVTTDDLQSENAT